MEIGPNPAMELSRLLASMKDENGRVLVDGFYDDAAPLSTIERKALADMPDNGSETGSTSWACEARRWRQKAGGAD